MNIYQNPKTLLSRHLSERCQNATANLYQWKALRIRQRQEIAQIGLLLVSLLEWTRMKQEIASLGLQQGLQLNLLKVRHRDELALSNYSLKVVPVLRGSSAGLPPDLAPLLAAASCGLPAPR